MKKTLYFISFGCISIFTAILLMAFIDSGVDPVSIPMTSSKFKKLLQANPLPAATKIYAEEKIPASSWKLGEGKGAGKDQNIIDAVRKHNNRFDTDYYDIDENKVVSPVVMMQGENFHVYGQFLANEMEDFHYGVIRGFDDIHYYIVHPTMHQIFTQNYICYGLPASDFGLMKCTKCKREWVYQDFVSCAEDKQGTRLYANPNCKNGGHHSFLEGMSVEFIKGCSELKAVKTQRK